jgi:hypothetical protein
MTVSKAVLYSKILLTTADTRYLVNEVLVPYLREQGVEVEPSAYDDPPGTIRRDEAGNKTAVKLDDDTWSVFNQDSAGVQVYDSYVEHYIVVGHVSDYNDDWPSGNIVVESHEGEVVAEYDVPGDGFYEYQNDNPYPADLWGTKKDDIAPEVPDGGYDFSFLQEQTYKDIYADGEVTSEFGEALYKSPDRVFTNDTGAIWTVHGSNVLCHYDDRVESSIFTEEELESYPGVWEATDLSDDIESELNND